MVKKINRPRHTFIIEMVGLDRIKREVRAQAEVIPSFEGADLEFDSLDVLRSMELNGVGDTRTCSVACCLDRNKHKFNHGYVGIVEWSYSRAYVASRLGPNGLPDQCVVYDHNNRWIAQLNDTPDGQKKLLEHLNKNGPMTIKLRPYRYRSEPGRSGKERGTTGARISKKSGLQLRKAVALGGAVPPGARGGPFFGIK